MNKLKTFFYILKKSIKTPEYYKELLETKFVYTVKYYVVLSVFASVVIALFLSISIFPVAKEGLRVGTQEMKSIYPNDLIISAKDGVWSINKPEPYVIPLPNFKKPTDIEGMENIIVFYKKGTIDDFNNFKTFVLVNEKNILAKEDDSGIKVTPIKDVPDFIVDKTMYDGFLDNVYSYLKYVPYFLPLIVFLGNIIFNFFGIKIIHIIFTGLLIYLFSLLRRYKLEYISACRIVIHTMTLPILLEVLFSSINFSIPVYSWFLVLNVILSIIIVERMFKETLNHKI